MFVMFTPYSFIFFSLYSVTFVLCLLIGNFYYYWMVMELIMLLFMGLSYTLFVSSYSQLMSYFLIQAISSFSILISFMHSYMFLFTVSLLLKLSMFPFYAWYINVIYRFPNFIFWLSGTLHKLPLLIMMFNFSLSLNMNLIWLSIVFTTLLSGFMMLMVVDLRMLLVLSSVGNNSWLLISQMTDLFSFLTFFTVYSFSLLMLLFSFSGLSKFPSYTSVGSDNYFLSMWVVSLSGMPPLPLFFSKMIVLFSFIGVHSMNYLFILFLLSNSLMVMAYLQSIMKFFVYSFSTSSHLLLKL
uniref:NADH-ubiquinone oxidoreductase chain 2 n=1 Tax=Brachionus koreanus TaxID=1199090 RepID=R4J976_9BILA|nr:NADH dehydrogenase subunit 2 [Brachionus koreanus]